MSLVNIVLNTILADTFKGFGDKLDSGMSVQEVTREALKNHFRVVFNGNNYCVENQKELTEKGLWRIDSSVEAMKRYSAPKNKEVFQAVGQVVLNALH